MSVRDDLCLSPQFADGRQAMWYGNGTYKEVGNLLMGVIDDLMEGMMY